MLSKSLRNSLTILFLLFLAIPLLSQSGQSQLAVIAGISVEGSVYSDNATIIARSGLRPGEQINLAGDTKLQNAVKSLWKTRQFANVDIIIEKITPAGVFLLIKVKENPRLNEIKIENNKELSKEDIIKEIGKLKGDIVSDYDIHLVLKKLKRKYSEEGLQFANVESNLEPTNNGLYNNLLLRVEEGDEFHVNSISFIGNGFFSDGDLEGAFDETQTKSWWQFWKSSKFDVNKFKTDLTLLKDYFSEQGFIDAEIVSDSISYNEKEKVVDIIVEVNEGKQVFIRNISFKGNTVFPEELLYTRLDFSTGDPYNAIQIDQNLQGNEAQTDVASVYLDNGFLSKRIEKEVIRIGADSVDLNIRIYEGDRVTLRRVDIVGNTKTKDKVIRRELYTKPGDYFNKAAIIRSIRGLGVLQYFNPEALKPDIKPVESDNTKVDLIYNVEERSTDTFNASIGFAGTFGLTGAIGMTFNNFSITEPLRGGGGQILNFNWEFGTASRLRRLVLGFTEPWLFDEPTTVGFNIFDTRHSVYYDFRQTGLALNVGRRFSWPDDYFRADWSFRAQENEVSTTGATYYRPGLSTEITIGQTFSRISLNSLFFPTSGSKFSFSSHFAMGALGLGNTDYLKNELNFEIYNPIMKIGDNDRMVLYLGSKLGYVAGLNSDTTISPMELYYMGGNGLSGFGVTPLRGYQDQVVGPRDGGRVLAKYTAELRFALAVDPMPVYTYLFAEAGNVWSSLSNTDPFDLKRSFGVGVQLMIAPIGVIGFSYGYGVDFDRTGQRSGWRFLFHLGQ